MATNADFYIFVDTVEESLEVQLRRANDEPADLTGASVEFKMAQVGSDTYKATGSCQIDDASEGKVTYNWSRDDTDTAGAFLGRFFVDYSDNGTVDEVFPNDDAVVIYVTDEDIV